MDKVQHAIAGVFRDSIKECMEIGAQHSRADGHEIIVKEFCQNPTLECETILVWNQNADECVRIRVDVLNNDKAMDVVSEQVQAQLLDELGLL